MSDAQVSQETEDPATQEQLQEAHQAEQVAESLALEANRTWAEAQRATQALRRDRGFGAVVSKGSGKCFNCGGNHFARNCPDRRHPNFGKGKGKAYAAEMDEMWNYYVGKGKGKSKGERQERAVDASSCSLTKGQREVTAQGQGCTPDRRCLPARLGVQWLGDDREPDDFLYGDLYRSRASSGNDRLRRDGFSSARSCCQRADQFSSHPGPSS